MTLLPKIAIKLNRLSFIAQYDRNRQRLYKLDFPIEYERLNRKTCEYSYHSTRYVLCSNNIEGRGPRETMLFPANWRGRMQSGFELGHAYSWDKDNEVLSQIDASIKKHH